MIKPNRNHRRAAAKGIKSPRATYKITPCKHKVNFGGKQRHQDTNLFQQRKEGEK